MKNFGTYVESLSQAETKVLLGEVLSHLTLPEIIEALKETLQEDDLDEIGLQLSDRS